MKRLLTSFFVLLSAASYALPNGIQTTQTPLGTVYTNAQGMTLYTFANDTNGTSTCTNNCLKKWPLATVEEGAIADETFTITQHPNGENQWVLKGQPLYTWVMDLSPGQTTGHGVGGVWFAAIQKSEIRNQKSEE